MTNPILISTPFAQNGDKSIIQESTGSEPNSATWEFGFPEVTSEPITTGGLPPKRVDFNGSLNAITENIVHQSKGLMYEFDAAYATKIGGYPINSRLVLTNGDVVQSTIDNNINNPNTDMTGWINISKLGLVYVEKVDSLTDLKNLDPSINNRRISIRNYGNAEMYWDSSSVEVANDIDIFQSNVSATGRWKWVNFENVLQGGVISDGVTDQTARINQITARLGEIGKVIKITIPENVKYNPVSVFLSLPLGVNLQIFDNINWGQPPTYKNRMLISYGNGAQANDTLHMVADSHHPAITLNNFGTSGSTSGEERLASLIHAVGRSYAGDPLNAQILQFRKDATLDKWVMGVRALIPYAIAMKDPSGWVAGKVYAAGDMCLSDGNKVYRTTAGGTAGATAPTGTGTGINDGGVVWDYYAARRSRDSTTFTIDEDGNAANYGNTGTTTTYQVRNAVNRLILQVDNTTTGDISLRDNSRGVNFLTSTSVRGTYLGGVPSMFFGAVLSGATPTISTAAHRVTNGSPVTMTGMNLPAGQTHGVILLHFTDSNTTIQNGATFALKGGINANPPVNGVMQFFRNGSIGSQWVEMSRSF